MTFKVEMHLHTLGNSRCAKVGHEDIVSIYSSLGYDAVTVTNHWNEYIARKYLSDDPEISVRKYIEGYEKMRKAAKGKLRVFFGMELALGGDYYKPGSLRSAELLIYGMTAEEFSECGATLYEYGYDELKKLTEDRGWLVIQAHPYRERSKRIPVKYLDGLEIFNKNGRHFNKNVLARLRAKTHSLAGIAGSDFHQPEDAGAALIFDEKISDEKALAAALAVGAFEVKKGN